MATLVKTDRNGTKYWYEHRCPKCGGKGYIPGYEMIAGGVCFKCGGSGEFGHSWKEYTPEYAAKLEERRLKKLRAKAPEKNAKILKDNGFNEEGFMWIVLGDTYSIKEELKAAGAKFDPQFFWHFDHKPEKFQTIKISIEDVAKKSLADVWQFNDCIWDYVKSLIKENDPKSTSEYVGNVGDKFEGLVTLVKIHTYETHFTYYGELNFIYKFKDSNNNTIVWKTGGRDLEEGKTYRIKGTIKEHSEYNDDKQTVLTRCRIEPECVL